MESPRPGSLTLRERQTIALLAHGLTLSEAADRMYITRATADKYRQSAYDKLDLHRRADVTRWVIRHGLDRMTPLSTATPRQRA